jgi:peptidyl-prolyl cis-trans isomerase C
MPAVPPDTVVLTIGDEKITAGEFEQLIEALPEQYRAVARGPNRRQFTDQIVRIKILAREAQRRKLDQNPAVERQMELQKTQVLAGALYQELLATARVDEAAERQYFEQHKAEYESARARHILVRAKGSRMPVQAGKKELSEEEALAKAQEIKKRLAAGEDFATVAKAESDDTRSSANGGELNTIKHGQMVAPFEQAAFSLPVGQISEPVKTEFGYHLIQVEQHDVKTFDEVRPEIEKRMRPEVAREEMEKLQKQVPVIMDERFFGPAPAPPAVPAQSANPAPPGQPASPAQSAKPASPAQPPK